MTYDYKQKKIVAVINTEIEKYMKVTKEDIINVAKKYLDTDKRVILEYVPKGYKD